MIFQARWRIAFGVFLTAKLLKEVGLARFF
jgi:hypothetical protein